MIAYWSTPRRASNSQTPVLWRVARTSCSWCCGRTIRIGEPHRRRCGGFLWMEFRCWVSSSIVAICRVRSLSVRLPSIEFIVSSLQLHRSYQAITSRANVPPTIPVLPGLSFRANFLWMLAGNVIFAGCQLGMIVALAKLGSSLMVGQFSLGLAIATPVLMFTNLHLRAVQATDATRLYSFGEYLQLRFVMSSLAIAAIVTFTWIENIPHRTAMVVVAVALAKGTETLSDVHYGLFQLHDRLDQTGRSMMLRGILSLLAAERGSVSDQRCVLGESRGRVGLVGGADWLGLSSRVPNYRALAAIHTLSQRCQPVACLERSAASRASVGSCVLVGAARHRNNSSFDQSESAAVFCRCQDGRIRARHFFGSSLCHNWLDPHQRLAGKLRHPPTLAPVRGWAHRRIPSSPPEARNP